MQAILVATRSQAHAHGGATELPNKVFCLLRTTHMQRVGSAEAHCLTVLIVSSISVVSRRLHCESVSLSAFDLLGRDVVVGVVSCFPARF